MRGARNPKLFGSSYAPPPRTSNQPHVDKSWRAIIVVVVVVVMVILLGQLPLWQIKTIELIGDKSDPIAEEVNKLLGQSIFSPSVSRLIKKNSTDLAVSSFDCRRGLPATLRCRILIRSAEIIWKSGETSYLIDQRGVVFATQSIIQPELLVVEDTKHQPITLGMALASSEIIGQYRSLVGLLGTKGLITKTFLLNESLFQVTALIERAGQTPIQGLFLLSGDVDNQVEALAATLATEGGNITERIDVRVPGYVYSK